MTDIAETRTTPLAAGRAADRIRKRYAAERRFRLYGLVAVCVSIAFLALMLLSIVSKGYTAFQQTMVYVDVHLDESVIDPKGSRNADDLARANYGALIRKTVAGLFPEVSGRRDKRKVRKLLSPGATYDVRAMVMDDPSLIGKRISLWVPASDDFDQLLKGNIRRDVPESDRRVSDKELAWIDSLMEKGLVEKQFNTRFFTAGASQEPELAGILGAAVGSFLTLLVTFLVSFPLGIMTATYLEEFAPKNRWTDLIEVNINNLAAVPSIVFGLLGLAVFLNFFGLPRSAPLVGGLVLALMTLPTIIITSRAALKAVPPSIREAAFGMGASRLQVVVHHVVPLAMPGILTGSIIGMAQALGETAPLLMIGMVAFVADIPTGFFDPATALPVQVYLWADSAERAFVERTSAAIMVLLAFLFIMNLFAVYLRKRFERRW